MSDISHHPQPSAENVGLDPQAPLHVAIERGASDVHLKIGRPPIVCFDGELEPLEGCAVLGPLELEAVLTLRVA